MTGILMALNTQRRCEEGMFVVCGLLLVVYKGSRITVLHFFLCALVLRLGLLRTANDKRQTTNGKRQTTNGKQQTANSKRQTLTPSIHQCALHPTAWEIIAP